MTSLNQIRTGAVAFTVSAILSGATMTALAQESTPVGSTSAYGSLTIGANSQDETFKQLRTAALRNDAPRAAQLADQLSGYPLTSYVEYYRLKPQLYNSDGTGNVNAPDAEVKAFIQRYDGQALADRMRNDYLYVLAARKDWSAFNRYYAQYELKDDVSINCFNQLGQLEHGGSASSIVAIAKGLMFDSKAANTKGCQQLTESLAARGISDEDSNYFTALSAYNSSSQGSRLAGYSKNAGSAARMSSLINQANNDSTGSLAGSVQSAASGMSPQQGALTQAYYGYSQIRRAASGGASFYRNAYQQYPKLQLPDDVLGWQARAGMREGDWGLVGQAIDKMSEAERNTSTWQYWRGRAYAAQGQSTQAALFYEQAANNFDFYGILAREELGRPITLPPKTAPTDAEVAAVSKTPGFERARKFADMDMMLEISREWNYPLRKMNDQQLLAAAEYGRRVGLLDRMINTSDRTKGVYNFSQRYPTPYLSTLQRHSANAGIPAAWAYGIIRQESRFVTLAKSSASAHGLMQIIPETARVLARKQGLSNFQLSDLGNIDTNVQLGTAYLAQIRDQFGGSMPLASAGYNAGPGRPAQWKRSLTQNVDGAVFAETIPFAETRGYVKNVMANTIWYYLIKNHRPPKLKDLMGTVTPY